MATFYSNDTNSSEPLAPAVVGPGWESQIQAPSVSEDSAVEKSIEEIRRENANKPLSPLEEGTLPDNTVVTVTVPEVTSSGLTRQQPIENPLLEYDSSTYNLSLHAIDIETYNNIISNPSSYVPRHVLIAGAGKYTSNFTRNFYFSDTDFFIDDLKIETVINTTVRNRFTNLIRLNFRVIEPLGFTFLQRLMDAVMSPKSAGGLGAPDYLKNPYLLQIEYKGYIDGVERNQELASYTKRLPIRLISVKSKVTQRGTEYQFEASPYNHSALDPKNFVVPCDSHVKARTVQDVFGEGFAVKSGAVDTVRDVVTNIDQRNEINSIRNTVLSNTDPEAGGTGYLNLPEVPAPISGQFTDSGICDAINAWWFILSQKNVGTVANQVRVVFDNEIGISKLNEARLGPVDISKVAEINNDKKTAAQQSAGINKSNINFDNTSVSIPAGSSIGAVIEWAVQNSEWAKNQIYGDGAVSSGNGNRPDQLQTVLRLIKIIPKVEVISYDQSRQDYAFRTTYYVKKFATNSKAPNAPQGRIPGFIKEYNYLFSGGQSRYVADSNLSNKEVLDVSLDFNMLYYTQLTAFKEKQKLQQTGPTDSLQINTELASGFSGDPRNVGSPDTTRPALIPGLVDRVNPYAVNYISKNIKNSSALGSNPAGRVAVGDILNTNILDGKGDMINISMRILGDPLFIKQDDLLYGQSIQNPGTMLTPNNSFIMDQGDLYIKLNFRSPEDYDESTGLAIPGSSRYGYSEFSGIYKIITINSDFTKGKFEQTLNMVRLPISDDKLRNLLVNAGRVDGLVLQGAGQQFRFPTTGNFGPRIVQTVFSGGLLAGGAGVESLANGVFNKVFQEKVVPELTQVADRLSEEISDAIIGIGDFFTDGAITEQIIVDNYSTLYEGINNFDF